jgi:hypothetical protein
MTGRGLNEVEINQIKRNRTSARLRHQTGPVQISVAR